MATVYWWFVHLQASDGETVDQVTRSVVALAPPHGVIKWLHDSPAGREKKQKLQNQRMTFGSSACLTIFVWLVCACSTSPIDFQWTCGSKRFFFEFTDILLVCSDETRGGEPWTIQGAWIAVPCCSVLLAKKCEPMVRSTTWSMINRWRPFTWLTDVDRLFELLMSNKLPQEKAHWRRTQLLPTAAALHSPPVLQTASSTVAPEEGDVAPA